jgi:hypothetical protein
LSSQQLVHCKKLFVAKDYCTIKMGKFVHCKKYFQTKPGNNILVNITNIQISNHFSMLAGSTETILEIISTKFLQYRLSGYNITLKR